MRTRIAVGLAAAFTAGMAVVPMSAKALCTQTFYAELAYLNVDTVVLTGRTSSTSLVIWSAETQSTDPKLANLIFSAVAQRNRLSVVGNMDSCPTTGTDRYMGTINTIVQQP
jgi:hypothetical protein